MRRFCRDNAKQRFIDVVVAAPELAFTQQPVGRQRVQITRGSEARDLQVMLDELDLGVREREQIVDEVLTVEAVLGTNAVLVVQQQALDVLNGGDACGGGGLDRDRKSVVWGKSVSVSVDLGGRRIIKKKKKIEIR